MDLIMHLKIFNVLTEQKSFNAMIVSTLFRFGTSLKIFSLGTIFPIIGTTVGISFKFTNLGFLNELFFNSNISDV